jgi:hypothetical protein
LYHFLVLALRLFFVSYFAKNPCKSNAFYANLSIRIGKKEKMIMPMMDVSEKSKKNEILDAYHEALQQIKNLKGEGKQGEKKEQKKKEVLESAAQHTVDGIVKDIATLKLGVARWLEEVEGQLLNEHKKLTTLQQAIVMQSGEVEEIHEVKVTADTLTALSQAQKQTKEKFEREMAEQRTFFEQEMLQKRTLWRKEKEEVEALRKEQETQQKKLRQREEEEYVYKRDLGRQKEQDQYVAQKQLLEKELADKKESLEKNFKEREANIVLKEQEWQNLQGQVETFPAKLQQEVEAVEKAVTDRLQFEHQYRVKLTQKEVEGERKLHQQMIAALEAKIAQQEQQITALTEKASYAGQQVQEIAVKAIEGASRQISYSPSYMEKSNETVKV